MCLLFCLTVCISATRVLNMTLNNLMVRLLLWRFGECGVTFHCRLSQVYSGSKQFGEVTWGYRTHGLYLCRGVRPPNEGPGYNTKQSDGEATVLELLAKWSTPSMTSLPGPLWPGVVSLGQIEPLDHLNREQTNELC